MMITIFQSASARSGVRSAEIANPRDPSTKIDPFHRTGWIGRRVGKPVAHPPIFRLRAVREKVGRTSWGCACAASNQSGVHCRAI